MPAEIDFPLTTILNESGTFTSDQNYTDLDASDVRSLLVGLNVTSITGSSGVAVSVCGKGPDGNDQYELGRINTLDGQGVVVINGPIPAVLRVIVGLNGASSATFAVWVIGQA